jgi:hypothetical protein
VVVEHEAPHLGAEVADLAEEVVAPLGCRLMTPYSSSSSGPGFFRIASGIASLPMS